MEKEIKEENSMAHMKLAGVKACLLINVNVTKMKTRIKRIVL
jgi:hypothetical protein